MKRSLLQMMIQFFPLFLVAGLFLYLLLIGTGIVE